MTRPPTKAELQLRAEQARRPAAYPLNSKGFDRVRALAGILQLPDVMVERFRRGALVFGEIGDFLPDARMRRFDDGSFLVTMTSGMMDFLYAVGRAMSGASVMWKEGAPLNRAALPPGDIAALLAQSFKQWRKHCQPSLWDALSRQRRIEYVKFEVLHQAQERAEILVTNAELFILAHELGHVGLELGFPVAQMENEELRADAVGFLLFFPTIMPLFATRAALASAAFAVRVMDSLTRVGVQFAEQYPKPPTRLKTLLALMRAHLPSEQYFDEAATLMVAHLDMMDAMDNLIGHCSHENELAQWQSSVSVLAALIAEAQREAAPGAFAKQFELHAQVRSEAQMRSIAQKLRRYYPTAPPETESYVPLEIRAAMGALLQRSVLGMSPERQALFVTEH